MSNKTTITPELQKVRESYLRLLKEVTGESDFFLGDNIGTSEADHATFRADDILRLSAELYADTLAYKTTSTKAEEGGEQ